MAIPFGSLYPHQQDAIDAALAVFEAGGGGFYLAHEVGLGKTRTAIEVAKRLGATRIVVFTRVAGIGVWHREVAKWDPEATISEPNQVARVGSRHYLVLNYEKLTSAKFAELLFKALVISKPDLVILDEAHKIKTPNTKTSRRVSEIAMASPHRLLLSGTPAHNPLDWWAQYRLIAPHEEIWKQSFRNYKRQIAILGGPSGNWVEGFRPQVKLEALNAMTPYTHHATGAVLNLPDPQEVIVPFELNDKERSIYDAMQREMVAQIKEDVEADAAIVLTQLMRLHQITGGHVTDTTGIIQQFGDTKTSVCLDLIDERPDQKILVACRFRKDIDSLTARLKAQGRPTDYIDGRTGAVTRAHIEDWFQSCAEPAVLLLQYQAGGIALTLTAAKTMILYSFEPSVIAYTQMLGRIWRIGQSGLVQILPLTASRTVDEVMLAALKAKKDGVDLAKLIRESLLRE